MKKRGILLAVVCLLVLFVTTGCMNKKAITTSEFKSTMESKGFTTIDVLEQFSEYKYVKEATVAKNDDFQIEFYVLSDTERADYMFNTNKKIFQNSKGSSTFETKSKIGNYETYSLTSSGYYMYISRVNNTVIYLNVNESKKDTVIKIIKDLGY